MSASTIADAGRPSLTIRGTQYPVLLPSLRDPRLHLAAIIITLQVLGQTAFGFSLSIAQILVALGTCAVLEIGISFFRQGVLLWPASALLTGNGVAFILRVPGTEHGDWWSLNGWWIYAGTAAVALLSKYLIRLRGRHLFNPSNFGLVLCFLALGKYRADPLDFWWGPMSPWLALALVLIVAGGLAILTRLRLLPIAIGFWLAFAAGIGLLAASGHSMYARWHLGPISGFDFWWLLVTSPEILIFLFFMITDPKTIPEGRAARLAYAVGVGLLATLLIAPQTTEFATKVAVLAALTVMCAARPLLEYVLPASGAAGGRRAAGALPRRRVAVGGLALAATTAFAGLVVLAGIPARPGAAGAAALSGMGSPRVTVARGIGVSASVDDATVAQITRDILSDLRDEADALRLRDAQRASAGVGGAWLVDLRQRLHGSTDEGIVVQNYLVERMRLTPKVGLDQGPPSITAVLHGTARPAVYRGSPPRLERRLAATPFTRTVDVALNGGRYVIIASGGSAIQPPDATVIAAVPASAPAPVPATGALAGVHLQDVAPQVGLNFRHGAFRYGVSNDVPAMMGGGLCWLDYDNDGWLDLFVVNSYADADILSWEQRGGLPTSALFHNRRGRFVDVSERSHAGLAVRGNGCVAADLNGDGFTDLYVTTASYDKLLWNDGDGTFTEGAAAAGIASFGWHTGAAVADVNDDGRPDLFVAGYTDLNAPDPTSVRGFPSTYQGVRDLLYLNEGPDGRGRSRFREVGIQAGLEAARFSHGLGAVFTDTNGDGRPDLYVADDEDPNQLYENVPWPDGAAADPAGLGFRLEERAAAEGVDDPYAGMGVAGADYDGDGRGDLFVTNSRGEPHAAFRRLAGARTPSFADGRRGFTSAFGASSSTGWGASWVDLALDGKPDLVLANGIVPVTNLARDAGRIQVIQNLSARRSARPFADVAGLGLGRSPRVNGRGLAAADYDNNGTPDIAVNSIGGPLVLLRNTAATGHWLEVKPARFAPGAVVTVVLPGGRRLVRELRAGSSYLSSEDPRAHFGLGGVTKVQSVIVRYPGGGETRLSGVRADRVVVAAAPPPPVAAPLSASPTSHLRSSCARAPLQGRSVARVWDEAALAAGRLSSSAPTVEARNLFHLSAAMWDAWAVYDPKADGYFVTEKHRAADVLAAREAAMSYAAYRILVWRSSFGANMDRAFARLGATMRSLCYRSGYTSTRGDSPAALGNRIAAAVIAYGRNDGSLERQHYDDPGYTPVNAPLVVSQSNGTMHDPTFWQPLALAQTEVQGGLPVPARIQTFAGSQWGRVRGFALPSSKRGLPIDPGPPPLGDPSSKAYQRAAVNVILLANQTASRAGADVPSGRLASLTAPARWNAIANEVADAGRRAPSAGGRLARDVRLYLALNGALHDAAVAAWGAKRTYQSARPISMIRYLAFQGQSSDPHGLAYNAEGLPLVPGLIEVVTRESSGRGERHAALASHVGDIAVRTRHGWSLGTRWVPPGRSRLVTPPYPGWVSDESAFGRAAAVILTAQTRRASLPARAGEAGRVGVSAGMQIAADDVAGRRVGSRVGRQAWQLARRYFAGTAR